MSTLTDLAERLTCNTTTTTEAGQLALEVTAGSRRTISGVESHVIPSMGDVERELAALSEYLQAHDYSDIRRWAGAYVMVQATLGLGDNEGAADLVRRVAATKSMPEGAETYVVAMIDAVLAHTGKLPTATVDLLMSARRAIAQPVDVTDADSVIDTIVACFEKEGWEYFLDPAARKLLIEFHFPFGQTRLVCDAKGHDELTIVALNVVPASGVDLPNLQLGLANDFAGVRAHVEDKHDSVMLFYSLQAASRLTINEIRNAIVHVNGAAEHLIMTMR